MQSLREKSGVGLSANVVWSCGPWVGGGDRVLSKMKRNLKGKELAQPPLPDTSR